MEKSASPANARFQVMENIASKGAFAFLMEHAEKFAPNKTATNHPNNLVNTRPMGRSVVIVQLLAAVEQPGRGDIAQNMEHPGINASTQTARSGLKEMGCALGTQKKFAAETIMSIQK